MRDAWYGRKLVRDAWKVTDVTREVMNKSKGKN